MCPGQLFFLQDRRFQKRKTDVNGFGWELDGNRVNLNGIGIKKRRASVAKVVRRLVQTLKNSQDHPPFSVRNNETESYEEEPEVRRKKREKLFGDGSSACYSDPVKNVDNFNVGKSFTLLARFVFPFPWPINPALLYYR